MLLPPYGNQHDILGANGRCEAAGIMSRWPVWDATASVSLGRWISGANKNGGENSLSPPCSYSFAGSPRRPPRSLYSLHIFMPTVAPRNQQEVLILVPLDGAIEVDGMCR